MHVKVSIFTVSLVTWVQIFNSELPLPVRILSPMKQGSDNPVCKICIWRIVVVTPLMSQWGFCTTRSLNLQIQVSAAVEVKIYHHLNMFQEFDLTTAKCYRKLRRDFSVIERSIVIYIS